MTYNVFIHSSIWNFTSETALDLLAHLKVKFPGGYGKRFKFDDAGDFVVLEDFDAAVTEEIIAFRRRQE